MSRSRYDTVRTSNQILGCRYMGNDRSMLIPNTLFRTGAAAIVLTNKRSERSRAKYELQHCVRVNLAADDAAYRYPHTKPSSG